MTGVHNFSDRKKWIFNNITNKGTLLDVGCNEGGGLLFYSKKAIRSFGIDISQEFIKTAKQKNHKINFKCEGIEKTSFKKGFFDTIILGDVLEHTSNEVVVLREINRIIKKNGELIITVPMKGLFSFLDIENMIFVAKTLLGKPVNWHKHYSIKELEALFEKTGFETTKTHPNSLFLSPLSYLMEYAFNLLFKQKNRFTAKLVLEMRDIDCKIDYGFLSYNLFVKAKVKPI